MKALKIVTLLLGVVLAGFLLLGLTGPKEFHVTRSVEIDAPPATVFGFVDALEDHQKWSPWMEKDPNAEVSFTGTSGAVGSKQIWSGNDDIGAGSQTITAVTPNERIDTHLEFTKPWESQSDAYVQLEPTADGKTRATWGLTGENGFVERIVFTFMSLDEEVGPDYEKGLANLKTMVESRPQPAMNAAPVEATEGLN